jgi:hypothetical protein
LLSCNFIEDLFDKKDDGLSEKEIAQIREDYETIDPTASEFVSQDVIDMDRASVLIEEYRQLESVEDAWLDIDGIAVKFKNYGLALWTYKHEFIDPPFFNIDEIEAQINNIRSQMLATTRTAEDIVLPSNNKVGIFCSLDENAGFFSSEKKEIQRLKELEEDLRKANYDVTPYYGESFSIESFKTGLKEFGTIIIDAHGSLTGIGDDGKLTTISPRLYRPDQHVWIVTGEKWSTEKYTEDYQHGRLSFTENEKWTWKGKVKVEGNVVFNEKLIEDYFKNKTLPNTLFYTFSCYAMHANLMGKVLEKKRKGEGVTIGYGDANTISPTTASILFEALLGGYTVKKAFDEILPPECKANTFKLDNGVTITANLVYYPESGGNVTLAEGDSGDIIMQSPPHDGSYAERVIPLIGICTGFDKNRKGTVSVGDLTAPLNFINDSTFSQDIEIKRGENIIKIVCMGNAKNRPVSLVANKELRITGYFPELPLYTALQWNTAGTDVDLHLVGPNGEDCYFYNKKPSWGGVLDIDDVNGFGPEHITIPVLKQTGTYTLYAHYYAANGMGSSQVWVQVETPAGRKNFGPHILTATGDTWQICDISFGSLTPPYNVTINSTSLRSGDGVRIFENLPAKKE